jgi:hypothetical protein
MKMRYGLGLSVKMRTEGGLFSDSGKGRNFLTSREPTGF